VAWIIAGWLIVGGVVYNAAAVTNITLKVAPDISSYADVTYDAATDIFNVYGTPSTYIDASLHTNNVTGGEFHLALKIDSNGVPVVSSFNTTNLYITGATAGYTTPLVMGQFAYFTFTNNGSADDFRFVFNTTGGTMSNLYGFQTAVVIAFSGDFTGSWTANFGSDIGGATPDTGSLIPEPSSQTLVLLSGCLFAVMGQRRRSRG